MTAFQIKLLAIFTMIVDHIGLFFFPDQIFFRVIGRLSFPLFAYLIANGARHTKNLSTYLSRLLIFACLSQIPYILANRQVDSSFWNLNILFTFFLALAAIAIIQKFCLSLRSQACRGRSNLLTIFLTVTVSVLGHFLKVDYGAYGVLTVILFYFSFHKPGLTIATLSILAILAAALPAVSNNVISFAKINLGPLIALAALPIISFYNGREGPKVKYLFYIFYPLQFVVFYLIKILPK